MPKRYEPPSDFLKALINDEAPLVGEHGQANLCRLIEMTADREVANRDWATLLLAQQEIDTPVVRDALLSAADDENEHVRAEAILGLARRQKSAALPFLRRELTHESVPLSLFEAAIIVADPSLTEDLRAFAEPSGDRFLDGIAAEALRACQGGADV